FWEPAGRDSIRGIFFDGHDPALEIRATTVSDQDIEINAATSDPGGAGEFLQQQIASEGPIRFFGYDDLLQFPIYDWPSSYREWYFAPEAQDLLINARPMMLDLYDVQGYNPVQISQYVLLLDALNGMQQNYHDAQVLPSGLNSPVIDLLGVRYIVVPRDVPPGRPDLLRLSQLYPTVFSNSSIRVLENPNALPRAWIVHHVQTMDEEQQGTAIASGEIDPATTALLETDELPELAAPIDAAAEPVTITGYQADQVSISTTASASGLVILSDVYARGWSATVNGRSVPLYEVDGGLRGVRVEAGANEIVMTYAPASLKYGFWISIVTMIGIVVALVILRRSEKHGTEVPC
ncbi:MAG: YfhO family protein, partial [Thermomicrobiales bacterium]